MAERTETGRAWSKRALFILIAAVIAFVHLMPLDTVPGGWPAPDLMLALTFAWALRRPAYVPVLLVAAVFLLTDLLFQRPPGLMAALVVAAAEWLKGRSRTMRDAPFMLEVTTIVAALVAVALLYRLGLAVMLLPLPPFPLTVAQLVFTALSVPGVIVISHYLFGVRPMAPGGMDTAGFRA